MKADGYGPTEDAPRPYPTPRPHPHHHHRRPSSVRRVALQDGWYWVPLVSLLPVLTGAEDA